MRQVQMKFEDGSWHPIMSPPIITDEDAKKWLHHWRTTFPQKEFRIGGGNNEPSTEA